MGNKPKPVPTLLGVYEHLQDFGRTYNLGTETVTFAMPVTAIAMSFRHEGKTNFLDQVKALGFRVIETTRFTLVCLPDSMLEEHE